MSAKPDCIEMSVGGLTLDPVTKTPIVILKDTENKLNLPIWIGLLEATAMATELKENTYYASINLSVSGGRQLVLDSRPSDAIALALRAKCPIYVAKAVLEASSVLQQDENKDVPVENVSNVSQEKWGEILEKMTPDDFKYKQ